ncbi:hypothetical protein BC829DRAFT_395421 [Chytridium lagenaria]|nr:hypothetical protein BC829DRAFT_395421 [Chytridium lagenaria]
MTTMTPSPPTHADRSAGLDLTTPATDGLCLLLACLILTQPTMTRDEVKATSSIVGPALQYEIAELHKVPVPRNPYLLAALEHLSVFIPDGHQYHTFKPSERTVHDDIMNSTETLADGAHRLSNSTYTEESRRPSFRDQSNEAAPRHRRLTVTRQLVPEIQLATSSSEADCGDRFGEEDSNEFLFDVTATTSSPAIGNSETLSPIPIQHDKAVACQADGSAVDVTDSQEVFDDIEIVNVSAVAEEAVDADLVEICEKKAETNDDAVDPALFGHASPELLDLACNLVNTDDFNNAFIELLEISKNYESEAVYDAAVDELLAMAQHLATDNDNDEFDHAVEELMTLSCNLVFDGNLGTKTDELDETIPESLTIATHLETESVYDTAIDALSRHSTTSHAVYEFNIAVHELMAIDYDGGLPKETDFDDFDEEIAKFLTIAKNFEIEAVYDRAVEELLALARNLATDDVDDEFNHAAEELIALSRNLCTNECDVFKTAVAELLALNVNLATDDTDGAFGCTLECMIEEYLEMARQMETYDMEIKFQSAVEELMEIACQLEVDEADETFRIAAKELMRLAIYIEADEGDATFSLAVNELLALARGFEGNAEGEMDGYVSEKVLPDTPITNIEPLNEAAEFIHPPRPYMSLDAIYPPEVIEAEVEAARSVMARYDGYNVEASRPRMKVIKPVPTQEVIQRILWMRVGKRKGRKQK